MVWVIVAGVLGVIISVTGGLFLRRLLGEITELRRQITGIDREMRAQRARVKFLRHLIDDDGSDGGDYGDRPPDEAAVANGGVEQPPHAAVAVDSGPEPVRRKRHLGLYVGGAVAALATISHAAREHRGQLIGAVTGAAVTATTVTMVTIQPWTTESSNDPPSSAPTAAPSPTYVPPPTARPQPTTPGTAPTASPSPTASEPEPSPSVSVSPTPSWLVTPAPIATGTIVPIGEESTPGEPEPGTPGGSGSPDGDSPGSETGGGSPPPDDPTPPQSAEPPPDSAPPSAAPVDETLRLDVAPLLDVEACLLDGT